MVKTTRKNNYVLKEKIVEIPEKLKEKDFIPKNIPIKYILE